MPNTLKNIQKIGSRWYTFSPTKITPFWGAISVDDGNDYWIGTDGSRTFLKSTNYQPSKEIKNYIKQKEGFRSEWYKDGNGYWTIGYGFKEAPELRKRYPNSITEEQANHEFELLLPQYVDALKRSTPRFNSYNQNQLDALLSYMYNIGEQGYTTKIMPNFEIVETFGGNPFTLKQAFRSRPTPGTWRPTLTSVTPTIGIATPQTNAFSLKPINGATAGIIGTKNRLPILISDILE